MAPSESMVLTEVDASRGIATLTLNRAERRNALSPRLLRDLLAALNEAEQNADARVIVLTGAGDRAFCAGGDLGGASGASGIVGLHDERGLFVQVIQRIFSLGKPVVARVNGHALGGGLGLMLACDLAVASDLATFGTPEVRVGLFPMMIMALIFRNIGRKRAMEMMLTGERMSAAEAAELGLINRVVPADELDDAVAKLADRIASFSPAVLKLGRDAVYSTLDMPMDQSLDYLRSQLALNTTLDDAAEGIAAFIEKRPPNWKGR